ncbi:MAG: indolepyruvate ferredoxin oxidoreductase subunit alpha [Candidatus Thorarchaeota archaeon]
MADDEVYRVLQRHLDSMPVGFPATDSGVEMRILKRLFSPEEAKIAAQLPFSPKGAESLDSIVERLSALGIGRQQLEQMLDTMVSKGLLNFRREGETKYYSSAQWMIGIYEYQVNKLSPGLFFDIVLFSLEVFGREAFSTKIPQLRTIPIEQSFTPEHLVANYDHVKHLVDASEGPFVVANCVCRQAQDLLGNPCRATARRETCLGFGDFAQLYIDEGWGREVSKQELLAIINQNAADGLILQPSNSLELEYICSCCGCCCALLLGTKMSRKPVKYHASNYYAQANSNVCTGCGTCIEVCQMEAIKLEKEKSKINLDRCIGCGVCTVHCPTSAITLQQKADKHIPPLTLEELYDSISKKKLEITSRNFE